MEERLHSFDPASDSTPFRCTKCQRENESKSDHEMLTLFFAFMLFLMLIIQLIFIAQDFQQINHHPVS
jgi:hypothetical protein